MQTGAGRGWRCRLHRERIAGKGAVADRRRHAPWLSAKWLQRDGHRLGADSFNVGNDGAANNATRNVYELLQQRRDSLLTLRFALEPPFTKLSVSINKIGR
jgi:hypothetical protein